MMLEHECNVKERESVHYHLMQKTLFISILAIHPMIEEEDVQTLFSHPVKIGSLHQVYHYGVDTTKRQKIEMFNRKNMLNTRF
jgi:hypothetical protein